jgi:HSP20 family molecular chaperone IbpA
MLRQSVESFYRRIALPKHADTDNISASFEDGTLKIVVPYISKRDSKKIAVQPKDQNRKLSKSSQKDSGS